MSQTQQQSVTPAAIEEKVANILRYTSQYAHAAAAQNDQEKVISLLRFAEHFALAGNFESARMQVNRAYAVCPNHPNIPLAEKKLLLMQSASAEIHPDNRREKTDGIRTESEIPFRLEDYVTDLGLENECKEIQELLCRAEYFLRGNSITAARNYLNRAYLLDPLNDSVQMMEQRVLFNESRPSDGIYRFIRQIKSFVNERNFAEAERELQKAYRQDPLNEQLHDVAAQLRLEMKRELTPVEENILYAHRYFGENQLEKAIREIRLGYLIDPFNETLAQLEQRIISVFGNH
ncbi:MAG: hypothetical protein WCW35_04610 [Bacteroidota bacterium]